MAIVTVSRGTFSGGRALAECVAEKLGYRCISREVLAAASRQYGVEEETLYKALAEKPGVLERFTSERVRYLAYIRAAISREVKDDNVVYHGHAGHFLLRGLPHVLRVKVIANMEFRIESAMERENLNREQAIKYIERVDDERTRWTKFLYHVDWNDPALYDIVINLDHISLDSACGLVCNTIDLDEFKTTPQATKMMADMVLSTQVRALMAADKGVADAGVEVEADDGVVTIGGTVRTLEEADKIKEIAKKTPGVMEVNSKMRVWPHW